MGPLLRKMDIKIGSLLKPHIYQIK